MKLCVNIVSLEHTQIYVLMTYSR